MYTMAVRLITICLILWCHAETQAQTLSGFVYDSQSGEKLIGAYIYDSLSQRGTTSNEFGFYSLKTNKKQHVNITISFLGYTSLYKACLFISRLDLRLCSRC